MRRGLWHAQGAPKIPAHGFSLSLSSSPTETCPKALAAPDVVPRLLVRVQGDAAQWSTASCLFNLKVRTWRRMLWQHHPGKWWPRFTRSQPLVLKTGQCCFFRVVRQASPGTFSRRTPVAFTGLRGEPSGQACPFVGLTGWVGILRLVAPVGSGVRGARWLHGARAYGPPDLKMSTKSFKWANGQVRPRGLAPDVLPLLLSQGDAPHGAMRVDSRDPAPCTGRGQPVPCLVCGFKSREQTCSTSWTASPWGR